ncbi:MAG: SDR family oxidoreductase [Candidatus Dormibacteraceae bacterium]
MELGLEGARALVTAASRGLGRACAEALAGERAAVFVSSRNEVALRAAADAMGACGHHAADLAGEGEIEPLVAAAAERLGGLDILVANAGGPPRGDFESVPDQLWAASYQLTLMSAVRLARAALPHLRRSDRGRIVFITSLTAREPATDLLLSSALRPAVAGLAKALASELAPEGVTVNCILPSRVLTDRVRELEAIKAGHAGVGLEDQMQRTAAGIPVRRFGTPSEVGAVCAFLCSRQAAYVTGQGIAVDGGAALSVH